MGWRHTPLVTGAASVPAITSAASDVHDVPEEGRASEPKNMAPPGPSPTFNIPTDLTQPLVEANSELKRLQQDLLILTSFNDNSSLYWRPSWFNAPSLSADLWTLHNPPHVVSEQLPRRPQGRQIMTRRLRRFRDAEPAYIKTQKDWNRHCNLYGVPHDFLCEDQVRLLRLGLPRTVDEWGSMDGMIGPPLEIQTLCEPPVWPLYPEPLTPTQGSYFLDPNMYTNLPAKFAKVASNMHGWAIAVHHDGIMRAEELEDPENTKYEGAGRRWSYLPWTKEQRASCQPTKITKIKLRFILEHGYGEGSKGRERIS